MKCVLLLCAAVCLLSVCSALPALSLQGEEGIPLSEIEAASHQEGHYRLKRATCDLMSFESQWITPNHAACALHCIVKGYKGGNCQGTICHCRN